MSSKKTAFRAVKGMNDILPGAREDFLNTSVWDFIAEKATSVLEGYGYNQVRLPVVEETSLFARGIGEGTDIVGKEMYTFEDRGERSLTLRPEGTAGATRAYVEHQFFRNNPVQRWWYMGPMYRAERPQKGRYRQFYQIGAEFFGTDSPAADAEMLMMLSEWIVALGISDVGLRINTLGDKESRDGYRMALIDYLKPQQEALCESCSTRLLTNPLRVLDCKRPGCKEIVVGAPDIMASLTPASAAHFARVCELLDAGGISYKRDSALVRGLDYYTGTIFEFTTGSLGAQDAILGGGRYDELVEELGGTSTPAIGFAAGVERLALLLATTPEEKRGPDLYIVPMGEFEREAFELARALRGLGRLRVEVDVAGGKLKQQFKRADRANARFALVLGENELKDNRANLKNLRTGAVEELNLEPAEIGKHLVD